MTDEDDGSLRGEVDSPVTEPGGGGYAGIGDDTYAEGARHARHGRASRSGRRRRRRDGNEEKRGSFWRELPVLVVVALGLALLIKAFVVQAYWIPSGSMENTLKKHDRVLVNKLAYDFHEIGRGDVVVFDGVGSWDRAVPGSEPSNAFESVVRAVGGVFGFTPEGTKIYIKRVIGLPGDHVECCDARGRVTVNGVPLNGKSYLYPGNVPSQQPFEITVPPGRIWVMGDHREISADSRVHRDAPGRGTVPTDKVIGRAFLLVWPPSDLAILSPPRTFTQPQLDQGERVSSAGSADRRLGTADRQRDRVPAG